MGRSRYALGAVHGCVLSLLVVSCGNQASVDYQGESLMTFEGRVVLLDSSAEGPMVPALAFQGPNGYWRLLDVGVEGEFPAGFTLHVFNRPPEDTISDLSLLFPGEPAVALAVITVVSPDHGPGFQYGNVGQARADCPAPAPTCPDCPEPAPCTRVRLQLCYSEQVGAWSVNVDDDAHCYTEVRECTFEIDEADENQDYESCQVLEAQGNEELGRPFSSRFHGYSQDHQLIYLEANAPRHSLIARMLGSPEGVEAGYHLLQRHDFSTEQADEVRRCHDQAIGAAYALLRASHPEARCTLLDFEPLRQISCVTPSEDRLSIEYEMRAQAELGCAPSTDAQLSIVDVVDNELMLRIGYDLPEVDIVP